MHTSPVRNPAGPGDNARPVEFPAINKTVRLRGGAVARYFGRCDITGKHRLGVEGKNSTPEKPNYYIWLLDDFGRCRCSPGPSDFDYIPAEQVPA